MAHMKVKGLDARRGTEKWCKILMIAEGKMNIYDRKNKMRREINSKMLKKGQQKSSMRLSDKVIMREKMEYKGHHHV